MHEKFLNRLIPIMNWHESFPHWSKWPEVRDTILTYQSLNAKRKKRRDGTRWNQACVEGRRAS